MERDKAERKKVYADLDVLNEKLVAVVLMMNKILEEISALSDLLGPPSQPVSGADAPHKEHAV
jgi:hypothetical protein